MKCVSCSVLAVALAAGSVGMLAIHGHDTAPAAVAAPAAGGFTVDPVHSSVVFRIKHNNAAYFYGRFNAPTGSFELDWAKPEASSIDVSVKTENVDTANEGRNKHLKQDEFFAAKDYPTISFKGKTFKKTGEHTMEVIGDLTLRGQTKPVTCTIEHTGTGKGRSGEELAGIETKFTIKRTEFGVSALVGPLGDEVTLFVALEGGKK